MNKNLKRLSLVLAVLLSIFVVACSNQSATDTANESNNTEQQIEQNQEAEQTEEIENSEIILSTTTSTENSGLLDAILPSFTETTGYEAKVVAVGTGAALQMGEDGEADVLLVHAKASEEEFVANGHGLERFDVMYNDFVLIGPNEDSLNLTEKAGSDIVKALTIINDSDLTFVSRGDDSGTHKKELSLWKEAEIQPSGDEYVEAGQGMGAVIQMTNELEGYTLTDRATYLSMVDNLDLQVLIEGDSRLFNQYGVIAVNPDKNDKINAEGAEAFISWLLSDEAQQLIGEFGADKFGEPLFTPNAE